MNTTVETFVTSRMTLNSSIHEESSFFTHLLLPPSPPSPLSLMSDPPVLYSTVFRDGLFKGEVVFVTGGGTGIGRCIAHEVVRLGGTVALAGRNLDRLHATAHEIN